MNNCMNNLSLKIYSTNGIDEKMLQSYKRKIVREIRKIYYDRFPEDINDFSPDINDANVNDVMIEAIQMLNNNLLR